MYKEVAKFQTMAFEMNLNGLVTDQEFSILEALTENMTKDSDALDLATTLAMKDLEDKDIVDSIIARKFDTALMIIY